MRAALALVVLVGVARAETPSPAAAAREQLELGLREYAVGKWADAIAAFRKGYEIDPRPELLYALAQAERMSGDCASAVATYRAFLRTGPPPVQADPARENLRRCEAQLAAAPPPAIPPPPAPHRRWDRDPAGGALVGTGLALVAGGAVLWGVGESAIESINASTRYDDFAIRTAQYGGAEPERAVGIAGVAVGGALVIAGIVRWTWVARKR